MAIVAGLVIFGVAIWAGAFSTGQNSPNVKFVYISTPNQIAIDRGQTLAIKFIITNSGPSSVSNVSIKTEYGGQQQFFSVDKSTITIAGPIGAGGRSEQTVSITGVENSQPAVEANFLIACGF